MTSSVTLSAAFGAGLISFISPCVLPLVPGYLSFVSGVNMAAARSQTEAVQAPSDTRAVLSNSLAFVLGFSAIFIILGASASAIGQLLGAHQGLLSKVAGVLLILFGVHMTGLLPIKALYAEKRFHMVDKPLGLLGAFLVGTAFAFGWTPCIGPVLSAVIGVASQQDTIAEGVLLLAAYSAGLGVPFLLAAVGINQFYRFFDGIKHHLRKVEIGSGVLLVVVGVLMLTNMLTVLSGMLPGLLPFLNRFAA